MTPESELLLNLVAHIALIYLLLGPLKQEKLDLHCPTGTKNVTPQCGDGNGKYHGEGKYRPGDSVETILNKIDLLGEVENNTVKWRRCLLLAYVATWFVFLLAFRKFPGILEFFLVLILVFLPFYGSYSYYRFHHSNMTVSYIKEHTAQLRRLRTQP